MEIYRVALFGHRDFYEHRKVERVLNFILEKLVYKKTFLEIYIGRNGEFDIFATSVLKGMQRQFGKELLEITLVLPYVLKDIEYYKKYYDEIIIPPPVEKSHPKAAITKRNRWMIENSDLILFYVERQEGGGYEALKYAKKLGKKIINLATYEEDA